MSLGKTRAAAAPFVLSTCAVLLFAQAASAATVTIPQACYVSVNSQELKIPVSGSGFTPSSQSGEEIEVKILAGKGLLGYEYFVVGDDGNFSGVVDNTFTPYKEAGAGKFKLVVEGFRSGEIYAEAPIRLAAQGVTISPDKNVTPRDKVTFSFYGFQPQSTLFAHYVHKGKELLSRKLGTTSGPCGKLKAKAKLFPAKHSRFPKWDVQFDNSEQYSPKSEPRLEFELTTGRF